MPPGKKGTNLREHAVCGLRTPTLHGEDEDGIASFQEVSLLKVLRGHEVSRSITI